MNCIYGREVYTGRAVVKDAYLAFEGTKVAGISTSPRGKVVGRFAAVTPAFIDAHAHIGLARSGEPSTEGEVNEKLEMVMPVPDALDSVLMDDPAFEDSIEAGILYSCVVRGARRRSADARRSSGTTRGTRPRR